MTMMAMMTMTTKVMVMAAFTELLKVARLASFSCMLVLALLQAFASGARRIALFLSSSQLAVSATAGFMFFWNHCYYLKLPNRSENPKFGSLGDLGGPGELASRAIMLRGSGEKNVKTHSSTTLFFLIF